jgi:hypothetical protein
LIAQRVNFGEVDKRTIQRPPGWPPERFVSHVAQVLSDAAFFADYYTGSAIFDKGETLCPVIAVQTSRLEDDLPGRDS